MVDRKVSTEADSPELRYGELKVKVKKSARLV
jgi:hypothetical protein